MSFKEALRKCCKVAAVMIIIIIPFIAGICAKEGAANGFESFMGWAAMADAVLMAALVIVYSRRKKEVQDAGESE